MIYYQPMVIKRLLERKTLFVLVLLYTGLITWASLARLVLPVKVNVQGGDKVGHLIAYFIFTIVWFTFFFFRDRNDVYFNQSLIKASAICFFYGILMELLQTLLTSYRSSEWYDVLANTSGIIFAVFFLKVFENKLVRINKMRLSVN